MTRIHMKTDEVRETARLLDWTAGELYYAPFKLKNLANSIAGAWQGGKSARYAAELRRQGELLQHEVINLQRLAKRVRQEVAEWENADNNGARGFVLETSPILPGAGGLLPLLPAAMYYQNLTFAGEQPATGGETSYGLDWEESLFLETSDKWTKSSGWENGEVELGVDAKFSLVDGAFKEGEGSGNWDWGGHDIGGAVGEYGVSQGEAGLGFGVGEEGLDAGAYGEYDLATASGAVVLGGSMLGITLGGGVSAVSAEGFIGVKSEDWAPTVGASVGASVASGEVGLGLNIAGLNIGLEAGLSAGVELGVQLGAESEVKVGPFKVGLNIGKAISD
ncbi:MAG: hypothetical protein ACOYZ8_06805 [Chloroflexota bacterium]